MRQPPGLPPQRFKPQCSHITMTRVYTFDLNCDVCGFYGPQGWLYRCTQDREDVIEHAVAQGYPVGFDDLGGPLVSRLTLRSRSAAARADRLSFLDEISPEQLLNYRPDQISTILTQRDEVQKAIARDKLRDSKTPADRITKSNGLEIPIAQTNNQPRWVPNIAQECRYMVCSDCRPGAADRAFLSLDAVVKGEIPPTSAVGFGFHLMGKRPIVNSELLKTIGCREAPQPNPRNTAALTSDDFRMKVLELLAKQLAHSQACLPKKQRLRPEEVANWALTILSPPVSVYGRPKHSSRCENLAVCSQPSDSPTRSRAAHPPRSPTSPSSPSGQESATEAHAVGLKAGTSISNGRSSNSLKMLDMRNQLLMPVSSTNALQHMAQWREYASSNDPIPYLNESEYDVGLMLPFDEQSFKTACRAPLGPPDRAEEMYLEDSTTTTTESQDQQESFTLEPVHVDHGVAMSEESVESGVPDIITQV